MLLGSVYLISPIFAYIPIPTLAGVLITAGIRMLNPAEIKHVYSVSPVETLPAGITFATLFLSGDLIGGVGLGLASSLCLNYIRPEGRIPLTWKVAIPDSDAVEQHQSPSTKHVVNVSMEGAINFLACLKMDKMQDQIITACHQLPKLDEKLPEEEETQHAIQPAVQLDMAKTGYIDATGCDLLVKMVNSLQGQGYRVQITQSTRWRDILLKSHLPASVLHG